MATAVLEPLNLSNAEPGSDLASTELSDFVQNMNKLIKKVVEYNVEKVDPSIANLLEAWMTKVLENNLGGGKMIRGLMVSMTFKGLVKSPSQDDVDRAHALGWVIEMLQAASLIADDMMDHSDTRRGNPCWYKNLDVQMSAINDFLLVEMLALHVLKIYFGKEPYYRQLYNTIHEILYYTVAGQCLDCLTEKSDNILESYTMERYDAIVKYKTSYYTMYAPVVLGMIMAGKGDDAKMMNHVEQIMLKIGHYFQVQDDYLDCFGDPEKTGKVGTDIQDNKCSWLFIKAVQLCTATELEFLVENYGKDEAICVENIRKLYKDINLQEQFHQYEDDIMEEIKEMVFNLQGYNEDNNIGNFISPSFFLGLLAKLYKRVQ